MLMNEGATVVRRFSKHSGERQTLGDQQPMAKELSPKQKQLRARARKAATAAGKNWKEISKEERRKFLSETRTSAKQKANPARDKAKKAAETAGQNWRELSPEQRRAYLKQARGKS
jgi:ABC-type transporter MlaC component